MSMDTRAWADADFKVRPWRSEDANTLTDVFGQPLPEPAADETCWVLHHTRDETQQAHASLRLAYCVGHPLPRYSYHVGQAVHAAAELKLHHTQRTLLLGNDLTGADELCGFGWRSGTPAPTAATWRPLLQAALRALSEATKAAPGTEPLDSNPRPPLIAELPGQRDAQGHAPFWQGLGSHFYPTPPATARAVHGPAWRSHVGALLPRQTLYASFLSAQAQAAIGAVHPAAFGLMQALQEAGFRWQGQVAVDDGGAVLQR